MKAEVNIKNICRVCNKNDFETILELKDTPLEDQYLKKRVLQKTYPLTLLKCTSCDYIFLKEVVNPKVSYNKYIYESKVTSGLEQHYKLYVSSIINEYKIPKNSLAVDLGSNDGLMLSVFKKYYLLPLGVEPAKTIAKRANSFGLETMNCFFTSHTAKFILNKYGKAKLITANYMFANIDDVSEFLKNVFTILDEKGFFVIQTGYHPDQFEKGMFDYIYHEHFSYFTLETLDKILKKHKFKIIDAKRIEPKGGSLRIIAQKNANQKQLNNFKKIIEFEKSYGCKKKIYFKKFQNNILEKKIALLDMLKELKNQNKTLVGFGASHSTTTLMYHFELHDFLSYIVDDNVSKHNTFTPGINLPVYDAEKIYQNFPDIILILAWQHQDTILKKHRRYLDLGGTFLIPLPFLKIKSKHVGKI